MRAGLVYQLLVRSTKPSLNHHIVHGAPRADPADLMRRPCLNGGVNSHRPIATGSGKRAAPWPRSGWVTPPLANIKPALAGPSPHAGAKPAQPSPTSFAYPFNRRFQLDSIVERLAWAA